MPCVSCGKTHWPEPLTSEEKARRAKEAEEDETP